MKEIYRLSEFERVDFYLLSNKIVLNHTILTLELPFSEHIEELRQRVFLYFG